MAPPAPNIFSCTRPLQLFLKFNSFLPIFSDRPSLLKRAFNVTFCSFNIVIGLLVAQSLRDNNGPFIGQTSDFNYFLNKTRVFGVVPATVLISAMVIGYSTNEQLQQILEDLQTIDSKVQPTNKGCVIFTKIIISFQLTLIRKSKFNYKKHTFYIISFLLSCISMGLIISLTLFKIYTAVTPMLCNLRFQLYIIGVFAQSVVVNWLIVIRFQKLNATLR